MADSAQILRALADGRFHSGEDLARALACSRSAIWKHIRQLKKRVDIHSVNGRGYRLAEPLELLDRELILNALAPHQRQGMSACHLLDVVTSTNELAMLTAEEAPSTPRAWFAEHQTGGRGRRGRAWHSPYGRNLYFSLLQRFDMPLHQLAGLSIAVGVAIAEMLSGFGLQGHGLKWPNDLHWQGKKLAGILIEATGEAEGPAYAVIGIGLNIDLGEVPDWIDQPVASLRQAGLDISRNLIAGEVLARILDLSTRFTREGLTPFIHRWEGYDLYRGRPVRLIGPGRKHTGIALGVSSDGGLRLNIDGREQVFYAGELSLRSGDGNG